MKKLQLLTVALLTCACGPEEGSGGTAAPEIPRYYAEEPNNAYQFAGIIPCQDDALYEIEGELAYFGDRDYIPCELPKGPGPHVYYVTVDYDEGWPMAVSAAWYTPAGTPTHLWGDWDPEGLGSMSFQIPVNASAGYLVFHVSQAEVSFPEEINYLFIVEVL